MLGKVLSGVPITVRNFPGITVRHSGQAFMDFRVLPKSFIHFLFGTITRLDDLDAQARGRVRAAQISAVVQLVPLTMTVNVVNAAVISYIFWNAGANAFLIVWSSLLDGVALAAFLSWRRTRRKPPKTASERGIKRMFLHATILGAVSGAAPLALFPGSDTMHQLFLAATMAGRLIPAQPLLLSDL